MLGRRLLFLILTPDCPQGPPAVKVRSRGPRRGEVPETNPGPLPVLCIQRVGPPCSLFFPFRVSPAVDMLERTPGKRRDRPGRGERLRTF